jgi:hypothetical protein
MMLLDEPDKGCDGNIEDRDRVSQRLAIPSATVGGSAVQELIAKCVQVAEERHGRVLFVVRPPGYLDPPLSIANARCVPVFPGVDVQKRALKDPLHMTLEGWLPQSIRNFSQLLLWRAPQLVLRTA